MKQERQFRISAGAYRSLATTTDGSLAAASNAAATDDDVIVACTDGPGYLTERARGGQVTALSGFCPRSERLRHPNIPIVCAFQTLLDLHRRHGTRVILASDQRCAGDAG